MPPEVLTEMMNIEFVCKLWLGVLVGYGVVLAFAVGD